MKLLTQQISIILWTIYFLVATNGINLHNLYCHCTGKDYISLFEIKTDCKDYHKTVQKELSCCERLRLQLNEEQEKPESKNCCDTKTKIVKADLDVLYASTIPALQTVSIIFSPNSDFDNPILSNIHFLKSNPFYRPPPLRRHGADLRAFIQSYLC